MGEEAHLLSFIGLEGFIDDSQLCEGQVVAVRIALIHSEVGGTSTAHRELGLLGDWLVWFSFHDTKIARFSLEWFRMRKQGASLKSDPVFAKLHRH